MIPPETFGLKEARGEDNNIIISYLILQNILSPQLKEMTSQYKVMCGCEYCISTKSMHSSLLSWPERFLNLNTKGAMHKTEVVLQ